MTRLLCLKEDRVIDDYDLLHVHDIHKLFLVLAYYRSRSRLLCYSYEVEDGGWGAYDFNFIFDLFNNIKIIRSKYD